jgi:hypothetical protein
VCASHSRARRIGATELRRGPVLAAGARPEVIAAHAGRATVSLTEAGGAVPLAGVKVDDRGAFATVVTCGRATGALWGG